MASAMARTLVRATLIALALAAIAAPQGARVRLIVQGDDMGAAHGVNTATLKAFKEGILRSTNIIVPGAWMPEAARMLKDAPDLDVGVHLALTSEWQRVKWRPLTQAPSLVDADGYFFPMVWPSKNFPPKSSMKEANINLSEAEKELRAQIELARRMVPRVSYLSAHMGFDLLSPDLRAVVEKLSRESAIPLEGRSGWRGLGRVWEPTDAGEVRAEKLAARLRSLAPGTYLFVDHCADDTPEIQALGHTGYEYVAQDRSAVVAAWTSPKVLEAVRAHRIKLISVREAMLTK
jgi:predicted glycoside hydrolase/deacetylase ChbG (UPF0249 family)